MSRPSRFEAIFDAAPTGLVELAEDGTILTMNTAFARLIGRPLATSACWNLLEWVHPSDLPRVRAVLRSLEPSSQGLVEARLLAEDGATVWVSLTVVRLPPDARAPSSRAYALAHVQDVTPHVQAEHVQRLEAIGQAAGGIAHDFNSMLGVISASLEIALQTLGREHPAHADVLDARMATYEAARISRQLLTFSRRDPPELHDVPINEVVRDCERFIVRLLRKGIDLRIVLADVGLVRVDRQKLQQLLVNLASNSRDAMPNGGVLSISTERIVLDERDCADWPELRPGAHVCIRVTDTGMGMSEEVARHAFEPFFTTKPRELGTGLGLSMAHGVVTAASGAIRLRSRPGRGTEVRVLLPERGPMRGAVGAGLCAGFGAGPGVGFGSGVRATATCVLVVDDELEHRSLAKRLLPAGLFDVECAATAHEARERSSARVFDVLLADIFLPDGNGVELAKELMRAGRVHHVVLMTAFAERELPGSVGEMPMVLIKPFSRAELLNALAGVLLPAQTVA